MPEYFHYSVEVPVEPHILKYLYYRFKSYTAKIYRTDVIGAYFYTLVDRPKAVYYQHKLPDPKHKFTFQISDFFRRQYGIDLTGEKIGFFNLYLDKLIKEELYTYVSGNINGNEVHQLIFDFMDKYNLTEEDIKFDTLKRYYYRERKRREE